MIGDRARRSSRSAPLTVAEIVDRRIDALVRGGSRRPNGRLNPEWGALGNRTRDLDGLITIISLAHLVTLVLQRIGQRFKQRRFVLDNKDMHGSTAA